MFGIVSGRSRKRNFYAAGMEEVSMRSFASTIDEPMLFQIGDELPNLTRHTENITEVKTSKQGARDNTVFTGQPVSRQTTG